MVRWSDGPMVRWSDGPMVRRSDGPVTVSPRHRALRDRTAGRRSCHVAYLSRPPEASNPTMNVPPSARQTSESREDTRCFQNTGCLSSLTAGHSDIRTFGFAVGPMVRRSDGAMLRQSDGPVTDLRPPPSPGRVPFRGRGSDFHRRRRMMKVRRSHGEPVNRRCPGCSRIPLPCPLPQSRLDRPFRESARTSAQGWLFGPWTDLLFVANIAWPAIILLMVWGGLDMHLRVSFWQIYFVTTPHRWITLAVVFCDRDRFRERSPAFMGVAVAIAAICLGVCASTGTLTCLLAIDYAWNAWHFAAQHHGIFRIYGRVANRNARIL